MEKILYFIYATKAYLVWPHSLVYYLYTYGYSVLVDVLSKNHFLKIPKITSLGLIMPKARKVRQKRRAMSVEVNLAFPSPSLAPQQGQKWLNLLKPGSLQTSQETQQEPRRQQVGDRQQPAVPSSLLTSVKTSKQR